METISTSTSKKLVLAFLLIGFVSSVSANFYYNQGGGFSGDGFSQDSFSIPKYDSHQEIATEFVAPFLFIAILLHFGFSRALHFILADGRNDPLDDRGKFLIPYSIPIKDNERPDVNRYSTIMSLVVTASLVPTPFFQRINTVIAWIFGGGIYLLLGIGLIYFLYKLVTNLW